MMARRRDRVRVICGDLAAQSRKPTAPLITAILENDGIFVSRYSVIRDMHALGIESGKSWARREADSFPLYPLWATADDCDGAGLQVGAA